MPKRYLDTGGKQDNYTYDTISDFLDFVPIVGGVNRFVRGEYKDGLINLGLDALGPLKYVAKGAKGIKMLANVGKIGKNITRAKRYEKAYDKLSRKLEKLSIEKGTKDKATLEKLNKGSETLDKIEEKQFRAEKNVKQGIKVLQSGVIPSLGKIVNQNENNLRVDIASGIHNAMVAPSIETAIGTAILGTFDSMLESKDSKSRDPGHSFLLNDKEQEKFMNNMGYFKTTDDDGIKMINKATNALKKFRGNNKINIYQIGEDAISRDSIVPIDKNSVPIGLVKQNKYGLTHAGQYPTVYYRHINPNKNEYYYRDIDLNDYGNHNNTAGQKYGAIQALANLYDKIGNPFIQKTGIQPMIINNEIEDYTRPDTYKRKRNGGTVKENVNSIYSTIKNEEFLGKPKHNYDFTQSEEWANAHGYYPDKRGHRDDRVKKLAHPSHPSKGRWKGEVFDLTNTGFKDPNYIMFGLNDGNQDPNAILTYKNSVVLPELTITPKGNYINNLYDNIRLHMKYGGIHIAPSKRGTFTAAATKHGMGVQEFAARVLRNKDDYSPSLVKKANFARNASKWNH